VILEANHQEVAMSGEKKRSSPPAIPPLPSGPEASQTPKIEVGWGDNMTVTTRITCPKCGYVNQVTAQEAERGAVRCRCGDFTIRLEGDGLRDAQGAADEIRRTLKDLFK
jgi:hypothetical protein